MNFLSDAFSRVFPKSSSKTSNGVSNNNSSKHSRGGRALKKALPVFRKISPNQILEKRKPKTAPTTPMSTPERKTPFKAADVCSCHSNVVDRNEFPKKTEDDATLPNSPTPEQVKATIEGNGNDTELLSIPNVPELTLPSLAHHEQPSSEFTGAPSSSVLIPNIKPLHRPFVDELESKAEESYRASFCSSSSASSSPPVSVVCVPSDFVLTPSSDSCSSLGEFDLFLRGPPRRPGEWDDGTIDSTENDVTEKPPSRRGAVAAAVRKRRALAAKLEQTRTTTPGGGDAAAYRRSIQANSESPRGRIVKWHTVRCE